MHEPPERAPRPEAPLAKDDPGGAPATKKPTDVVFVHGATPGGVQITRLREDRVEAGELRPLKEGQPIAGELVKLSRREESERLFDVEVVANVGPKPAELPSAEPPRDRRGPTRVSNERFRTNWDVVFGARAQKKGDLPS
jgi:hypothetical protein